MAELKTNIIYCGDNKDILSELPEKSVDLIYADPPFFSNRHYEVIWNDGAEVRAFEDRWQGGIEKYIDWMESRLRECHKVLKDTGSMYLHCDWHANAHLRIRMDKIFGESNFQNEIIWHYRSASGTKRRFSRKHDTLLFYSKTDGYKFYANSIREPYAPSTISRLRYNGARSDSNPEVLQKSGRIPDDVWLIEHLQGNSRERIGYPTQKPEALLKKVILASSTKNDIVLDPFCGCGTTIAVAQKLGRKWIGIDVSPTACRMMQERLNRIGAEVTIIGMPTTIEELKSLEHFNFQDWVINKIKGTHSNSKVRDGGIDGWTFMNHEPVQVKQQEKVGRPEMQKFQTAIRSTRMKIGHYYAFSYSKDAIEEVSRANRYDGITINLITIQELLESK